MIREKFGLNEEDGKLMQCIHGKNFRLWDIYGP